MQAVILAGGLGTRLRPLTYPRPKALLPLLNKPILLHILERMPSLIDEVIVAANYRVGQIQDFVRSQDLGRNVTVVKEAKPLGTGGAIKNLEDRLSGTFLACNGDIVCSLAVGDLLEAHHRFGGVGTIALWEVDDPGGFGVVAMKGDRITKFVEKPPPGRAPSRLVNAGMYVLEPEALAAMKTGAVASLERDAFPALIRKGLYGFLFSGYWSDVGTRENFLNATAMLLREQGGDVSMRASMGTRATILKPVAVAGGTTVYGKIGPSVVIGRDGTIGEQARVRDSVLFDRVVVGEGAQVMGTLVGDDCRIGSRAKVEDSILEDGAVVLEGAEVVGRKVRR